LPFCHLTLRARKPRNPAYPRALQTFGDHLRARRLDLGLLQREMAAQLGVSVSGVRKWEAGRSSPPVRYRPRLIDFLGYCPWQPARHRGDVLREAREAMGLLQERFAALAGADPASVSVWETEGRRVPSALVGWLRQPAAAVPRVGRSRWRHGRLLK
jgi:DNA-binding transcriptional regulator YiaG